QGSAVVQEAYELIEASGLNFIGNVEGRDVPLGGADILVTDGFTGNVVEKTMEGTADLIMNELRNAITSRPWYAAAGLVLTPAFSALRKKFDYREYGAGPLLGVNGLVFIGQGRSDGGGISWALEMAGEGAPGGGLEAAREAG